MNRLILLFLATLATLLLWLAFAIYQAPRSEYRYDWVPASLSQSDFDFAMQTVIRDTPRLLPSPRVVVTLRAAVCTNPKVITGFKNSAKFSHYPIVYEVEKNKCQIK